MPRAGRRKRATPVEAALPPWLRALLAAALALLPLLALADFLWLHPGYSEIDEAGALRQAWMTRQGYGPGAHLFTCSFFRYALAASLALFEGLSSAPVLVPYAALLLECALLWAVTRRLFNVQVASGALLFNLISALTLVRARSLLGWAALPMEAWAVLALLALPKGTWKAPAAGLLAALLFLEYEGWPAAALGLALALPFLAKRLDFSLKNALIGFAAGLALVLWFAREDLASYLAVRLGFTLSASKPGAGLGHWGWGGNLLAYFMGGPSLPSLGVNAHPALPPWAWPLLGAGLWRVLKKPGELGWILALLGAGLALLLPPTAGLAEPNRAAAAWPAWCLLAGLGFERALAWARGLTRLAPLAALAWAAGGAVWEGGAFLDSQEALSPKYYAPARTRQAASRWLLEQRQKGPLRVLTHLGPMGAEDFEWHFGGSDRDPQARVFAYIPWEALPVFGPRAGGWWVFADPLLEEKFEIHLLEPGPALVRTLAQSDAALDAVAREVAPYHALEIRRRLEAQLARPELKDPWVRTALWQRLMTMLTGYNWFGEAEMSALRKEKLLHAGPLFKPAIYLSKHRPDLAAQLRQRAEQVDPRLREQ